MAEKLQFKVEEVKGAIYVFDKTGKYQRNCNEGGWGQPNLRVSDISKAELSVFPPEKTEPIVIDVYPYLPNDTGIGFEILAQELGLQEIISGVWKFELRVWNSPGEEGEVLISQTCYLLLDGVISCCIESRKLSCDDDPSSESNKKIVEMSNFLKNANYAICEGNIDRAQKIIKHLNLQCKCC